MGAPLCEVRVVSRRHRYAGTLDAVGLWQGAAALVDVKTGSPSDVGTQWQTAAYVGALLEMIANGDDPDVVQFDPVPHTYTLAGERLPSVTQVLQASGIVDFSHVPQPILLAARDRGSAVHQAVHYYNEDDINLDAFRDEFPEYWPYLAAWIAFREQSGFEVATSFDQLAALTHLTRYAVQLRRDGTYRVEAYTAPSDYPEFLALLRAREIVAKHRGSWIEFGEAA
jgi:hypothetical protein